MMLKVQFDEAKVDAVFAGMNQSRLPGAAVAIAIGGIPVYRKGFGLANMELPTVLSPSMRMRIGSTTKHFAALAYLLLCEEKRCGLDDPIGEHVPNLHKVTRDVTVRQLLSHTSGIRDVITLTMLAHNMGRRITDREMVAYYETIDDVDFAPDTSWSYNNGGYILVSAAIERIAGEPLDDVLRKRIFEPLGMNDTMLRRWDSDFVPNSATLHMRSPAGVWSRDYMGMEISGAGGMVSSMDDMLRWLKHMDAPTVGSAETWRQMREPRVLKNGTSTGYGLGLITSPYRGVETVSHAGGVMGGNSQMIKVPAARLDISIAVNRADVMGAVLALQVIDACVVEGLEPVPAPIADGNRAGTFVSKTDGRVLDLSIKDDVQFLAIDGGLPMPMTRDSSGELWLPAFTAHLRQSALPGERSVRFKDFGDEVVFDEITVEPEAMLGAGAGSYRSDSMAAAAELSESDEGARMRLSGRYGTHDFKLEPVTAKIWRASSLGPMTMPMCIVTLDDDGKGLDITSGRGKHYRFKRTEKAAPA
jgi:CubicO group peptidase (beta-lactamase class C family)